MEREEVSIVIPVYNRESLVRRTLDSVAAQTWRPLRVIVVDNNSTDGTVSVVREWKASREQDAELRIDILEERTPGASAARNRGLAEVSSRYVLFFDSDDEMMPRLVEKAAEAAANADLVYWKAELLGLDGNRTLKPFHTGDLVKRQFYNSMLATQVYMVRTDFIRDIGGWNERAAVWNDWELGVRIALASPVTVAIPEILVRINAQEDSITGRRFIDRRGEWERTLDLVEAVADGQRRSSQLRDMLTYRRVILAAQYRKEGDRDGARELLDKAIGRPGLRIADRILLRLIYAYTAAGGRGAYYMWR